MSIKTFKFEIDFEINGKTEEMETLIGATDIDEAKNKVIDIYKRLFDITLTKDNFIKIGEYNANE